MKYLIAFYQKIKVDILYFFVFGALVFILNSSTILLDVRLPIVGGFDGQNHLAIAEYYTNHIFPKTWGWVPLWYGGMPFPQFYPPLFYFLLALLSKIAPFSFVTCFKLLTLGLFLAVPGLIASVSRRLISPSAAIVAGILSVLFLTDNSVRSYWGVSLYAMFHSGLETQFLGFVLLVPWLYFMLTLERSKHAIYTAQILLFLLFLSNAHIVPVAGLLFLSIILTRINRKNYPKYLCSGIIPLLAASFWYIPMLVNFKYLVSIAITPNPEELTVFLLFPGLFILLVLYYAFRVKNRNMLVVPATFLMLLPLLFLSNFISNFPVNPARMVELVYSLLPIPLSYLVMLIVSRVPSERGKALCVSLLLLPLIVAVWVNTYSNNYDGFYLDSDTTLVKNISTTLKGAKGLVHVERYSELASKAYTLNAILGQEGIRTNYINFRESAISSMFRNPLLNSLSRTSETWGIKSFLADDQLFLKQPLSVALDRARFMDVNYFLMQSYQKVASFNTSPDLYRERDIGSWKLFSLKTPGVDAEVPNVPLMLLFSKVAFKDRELTDFDYVHIQEELLFSQGYSKILFAEANDLFLDTTKDLFRFDSAMISQYNYHSQEEAFARLREYSYAHHLVLVEDRDPLFSRLANLHSSNIYIVKKNPVSSTNYNPVREEMKKLFVVIATWERDMEKTSSIPVQRSYDPSSECTTLSMEQTQPSLVPVLIKDSYFPAWKNMNGQEVYMASPSFMLTFIKATNEKVCFKASGSLYAGVVVSVGTFFGFCYMWYTRPRFMRPQERN